MDRRKTDRRITSNENIHIPDVPEVISILYKRKILILLTVLVPVFCTAVFLKASPEIYRATASAILENENLNFSDFRDILQGAKFDDLTVPTQIEVITSNSMVKKTIETLNLKKTNDDKIIIDTKSEYNDLKNASVKDVLENMHVYQQGTSRVINIAYDSESPETATKIANTHIKSYVNSLIQDKRKQAQKVDEWVSSQIETLQRENLEKAKALQKFKSDHGMVQGLNSKDLIYQQISDIAKQLSPIETKELDLRARVELLDSGKEDAIKEIIESELIQQLKARTSEVSQELQALKSDYGKNHPELIAKQKELYQIKSDMNREIKNTRKSIENELKTTENQKKLLNEKLHELQEKADTIQSKQIELQALEISEAASKKQLDNFFIKSEEIKSQIDFTRTDVSIVSEADVPDEPKGSKKSIILAGVLILSSMLALALVTLLEIVNNGITRLEYVKRVLNVKLLGTLPDEANPINSILSEKRSSYVEEIKRIYIHLTAQEVAQTLLFTSARNNEGKTLTAIALSYFLSSIGKRVILIDANTVKKNISVTMKTENSIGFYELLSKQASLKDVIVTDENHLDIIPAGHHTESSSGLLLSQSVEPYLNELRKNYDYIIIDTASYNDTSDAEILARICDQTIILCTWAQTPKGILKDVCEKIREVSRNAPLLILNKIPETEIHKN